MTETQRTPDYTEGQGIPDHADDTSTAYDDANHPRLEDSPPAMPSDEPLGVEEFGTTAEEQRSGEPMAARLIREEPDVAISGDDSDDPVDEQLDMSVDDAGPTGFADEPTDLSLDDDAPDTIGRLVDPDEGGYFDDEAQAIAFDSSETEGLTAEEAAMHVVSGDDVRYE